MMKKQLTFLGILAFSLLSNVFAESAYLRLPPMPQAPEIDGRIWSAEWRMASPSFGSCSQETGLMSVRDVHHHIGYDDQYLYIAQQSALPPGPMLLSSTGTIFVAFGEGDTMQRIDFDTTGACAVDGVVSRAVPQREYLEFEAAIPWQAFGIAELQYGKEYKLQVGRDFQNLGEHVVWSPDGPGTFVPQKNLPVAGLKTFGKRWKGYGYEIQWSVANPGVDDSRVTLEALMVATDVPRNVNTTLEPAPDQEVTAVLRAILQPMERRLEAEMTCVQDGKPLYRRTFSWEQGKGRAFEDPDPPFVLDFAFYPTYGFIKAKVSCSKAEKFAQATQVNFKIVDESGEVHSLQKCAKRNDALQDRWELQELPEGRYDLVAEVMDAKGAVIQEARRDFAVQKFPWQGLGLGAKRVVLPPYVPLKYSDREVQALQTGFHLGGGLWDAIYAQGENLLTAPVALRLGGQQATMVGEPELLEQADDHITLESHLSCGKINVLIRQEYDFDGFCKVTMTIEPTDGPVKLTSAQLDIPLKAECLKYVCAMGNGMRKNIHRELAQEDGVIWASMEDCQTHPYHHGFRPYIWFGEIYKGLAFVCESPANWERVPETSAQELIRKGDTAVFRLNLANQPFTLDAPREYVLAFQPTPTRPQDTEWRNQYGSMYNARNPKQTVNFMTGLNNYARFLCMRVDDGICQVPNDDWSFIEYLTKNQWETEAEVRQFAQEYLAKNHLTEENFSIWNRGETEPGDDLLTRMWQGCRFWRNTQINLVYMNPRACCPSWPERDMFVDEWFGGEWRPSKNYRDEYSCHADANYCDFLLWNSLRMMKWGFWGLYLDNLYDSCWIDYALNPYGEDTGAYWPFFKIRELIRRAATVSYEEGFMLNGRPMLMIHETDCNVVPWLSLASHALDWEMNFGDRPFPERFSNAYLVTNTLGTQTGATPMVLMNSSGSNGKAATESLMALCYPYGLLSQHDSGLSRTERYFTLRDKVFEFGYGNPDTEVFPCWDDANPVRQLTEKVRCTFVRRSDGEALLLVGNLGAEDAEGQFVLPGKFTATDAETGETLPVDDGNRLAVPVKGYTAALIHLKP